MIIGESFVKPLQTAVYSINQVIPDTEWRVYLPSDNKDVEDVLTWTISEDQTNISVTWTHMVSGSYEIAYGDLKKTIIVESLF